MLKCSYRLIKINQCCRDACQISEQLEYSKRLSGKLRQDFLCDIESAPRPVQCSANSIQLNWQHLLQGTRQKWTDLSHHAQLSMCTSRDKMAASGMDFSVLIECEFVAVVSWKVGWLCCFYTKFALVWLDDWWVSFTRPWAVFTRLGRPDEWLVRTL